MTLEKTQTEELEKFGWEVVPNFSYVNLFQEDFNKDSWEQVCQQLQLPLETDSVTLLYVGKKTGGREIL